MGRNCAKNSASEMFSIPTSGLRMVNFKGKSMATTKSNQSNPQRKEIRDWH